MREAAVVLRLMALLGLSVALLLLWCAPVLAHAGIVDRQPDDGANLKQVPVEVRIRFNEPVEAEFSPLEVYNSEGRGVDRADAGVDPDNPRVVRVSLQDLSEGTYTVQYRITSLDGHVVDGEYDFRVAANTAGDEQAGERPANQGEAEQSQSRGAGLGQTTLYSILSLGALGVVVLAILGVTWLRQRKP
jgi:copper resistance protein C